jgi:heme a synthase
MYTESDINVTSSKNNKIIATWLYIGVILIIIQVLLGGVTRLTGSGLSITEWKPIMGALPPLNAAEWQTAFEKYQQIGQYKYINADFTMADFKFIFFWEWFHRNWARFIGLVFFVPFVWFIAKGMIDKKMVPQFILIFFIGALQGLVGWLMVASGLNDDMLFVHYFKLATHFITALLALAVVYWFALYFSNTNKVVHPQLQKNKYVGIAIIVLLAIQLCYGAFMAGLKAAAAAPTWPSINGAMVPAGLWQTSAFAHPIFIHFIHRNLAYILCVLIIIFCVSLYKKSTDVIIKQNIKWPILFVFLQIILGISTVLFANHPLRNAMGKFEWSAQLHQLVALFLLLSIVKLVFFCSKIKIN